MASTWDSLEGATSSSNGPHDAGLTNTCSAGCGRVYVTIKAAGWLSKTAGGREEEEEEEEEEGAAPRGPEPCCYPCCCCCCLAPEHSSKVVGKGRRRLDSTLTSFQQKQMLVEVLRISVMKEDIPNRMVMDDKNALCSGGAWVFFGGQSVAMETPASGRMDHPRFLRQPVFVGN
ncbi:hypothetical protein EYF80_022099 [Liparis tanakae]|uniref:Uncharacterized protein n=1 Tax=Liparis tanakae TaxID=230148 RepID=A0A4Z2HQQ9_9TELE|nr:hypothetical protein EYF80_022099 [Liparis tanakae]